MTESVYTSQSQWLAAMQTASAASNKLVYPSTSWLIAVRPWTRCRAVGLSPETNSQLCGTVQWQGGS